jgi:hypothetical protein
MEGQECARCLGPILPGQPIALSSRGWIHASCASGSDDE